MGSSTLRQSGAVFAYRLVLVAVVVATEVILARALGPAGRGLVAIFTITPVLIAVVASCGLDYAVNFFGHQDGLSIPRTFRRALWGGLAVAMVLCAVLFLDVEGVRTVLFKSAPEDYTAVEFISLGIVPAEVFFVLASMLAMTLGRPVLYGRIRVVRRGIVLLSVLAAAWVYRDDLVSAVTLVIFGQIAAILTAGMFPVFGIPSERKAGAPSYRELFSYGLRSLPARLAERLQTRIDIVLLGLLSTSSVVGVYTVATGIAESLFYVSGSLSAVLFTRSAEREGELHQLALRVMIPLGVVFALVVGSMSAFLIPVIFGQDFSDAVLFLWVLLPGTIAFSLVHIVSPYFVQKGHSGVVSVANSAGLVGNVGLNIVLIPGFGGIGAAIASAVSYGLTCGWLLVWLAKIEEKSPVDTLVLSASDVRGVYSAVRREVTSLMGDKGV